MWESLREATDEEMERDPAVCVMGALHAVVPDYGCAALITVYNVQVRMSAITVAATR